MEINALRYHEHGKPADVLRLESLDLAAPGPGEAVVALRAAVLHPSDLGMIGGVYGRLRELPAVAGREGVGEVLAIGPGVSGLRVGDRVRMPEDSVLVDACLASAEDLDLVPAELPIDQAAMAFINPPTAYRLLEDFVALESGDWLIQNAANSAVGQCVISLARERGVRTINLVRDVTKWSDRLKGLGADLVLADSSDFFKEIPELTGGAKAKLGLNSIGGDSVIKIIRCMAESGVVVTFGGMVGDKVRFPTRNLIFDDVSLRGFWMDRWSRVHDRAERQQMQQAVFELLARGVVEMDVAARFPLSEGINAFAVASESSRDGKIIVTGDYCG
ncbi:MAG: 2-enoyl thioester reductase domain-containing protein [Verrucomicrobiota bacterium]